MSFFLCWFSSIDGHLIEVDGSFKNNLFLYRLRWCSGMTRLKAFYLLCWCRKRRGEELHPECREMVHIVCLSVKLSLMLSLTMKVGILLLFLDV